jgi:hypothetical protein
MPDLPRADAVDDSSTSLLMKIRQAFGPTGERFTRLSDLANAFSVRGEVTNEADVDDWRLVDLDIVVRNENLGGLLIFMDGPTWRHYLPIWLTIAATRGAELRDFVSVVTTTLDPESTVLADDASRFVERASTLTDAQRAAIADVLATFTSIPWIRSNGRGLAHAERLAALWRQGDIPVAERD